MQFETTLFLKPEEKTTFRFDFIYLVILHNTSFRVQDVGRLNNSGDWYEVPVKTYIKGLL